MLTIKVSYNKESSDKILTILEANGNPMFEFYNEDDPKQLKKSWKNKSVASARDLPFIGVYENNKLIKGFYAEDNSSIDSIFFDWLDAYIRENAKSGWMSITKIDGTHNEKYTPGTVRKGKTSAFIEGVSLFLMGDDNWYKTSPIISIDWEGKTFKTCNSTYSFELDELSD